MNIKKLTICAMFVAIGVITGSIIYIPIGASRCFPIQHTINVLSAVLLGPGYAVLIAFCISLLRNFMGLGSLLAFPGSMIGAFMAGIVFKATKSRLGASIGEVFGTGIIGGMLAFPISAFVLGKETGAFVYVYSFLLSSFGGSVIAYILLRSENIFKLREKF